MTGRIWTDPVSGMTVSIAPGGGLCRIEFPDLARFELKSGSETARLVWQADWVTSETLDHLLHDHVLPRAIAGQGELVLHAGGIVIAGRAIVLTAATGRGKSTLTASLHAAGHPLLGDDALVISGNSAVPQVRAVYPSLRLNPDSAARFFPGVEGRPMAQYSDKRHLPPRETAEDAPLAALFVLGDPAEEITARRLAPAETCMQIIANSFALDPTDKARAQDRMLKASALARDVPAWELRYPRDYGCLPAVHQLIRNLLAV